MSDKPGSKSQGKPRAGIPSQVITDRAVRVAMDAAIERAESLGANVCVAVFDSGVNLAGFLRMPASFNLSRDMSIEKARTVASLGLPMDMVDEVIDSEAPRVRRGLEGHAGFTPVHGAVPIVVNEQLLGAVGVSGGSEAQDVECAQAAADAICNQFD